MIRSFARLKLASHCALPQGQSSFPLRIFSLRSMAGQVLTTLQAMLPLWVSLLRAASQIATLQPWRACDSRYKRSAKTLSMSVRKRGSSSARAKPSETHRIPARRYAQLRTRNIGTPGFVPNSLADARAEFVAAPLRGHEPKGGRFHPRRGKVLRTSQGR